MSSFIQVNIYNETIERLKTRGIDLKRILENSGCSDIWIGEIPIQSGVINKPFKTISAEIANIRPLDDYRYSWARPDPTPMQDSSEKDDAPTTSETNIRVKIEEPDAADETMEQPNSLFDMLMSSSFLNDPVFTGFKEEFAKQKENSDDTVHAIKCQFPGCEYTYSWKVKYGKLRLIDHALTHNSEKLLACRICGESIQNVRAIRTHYAKMHQTERPVGYGMKSMPINENSLRELWQLCYGIYVHVVGEAAVAGPGGKVRRIKRNDLD